MEFLLLMMLVEISMVSSILLSVSFSNGFTLQKNRVGDIYMGLSPKPLIVPPPVTDRLTEISTKDLESPPTTGLSVEGSPPLHSFSLVEI